MSEQTGPEGNDEDGGLFSGAMPEGTASYRSLLFDNEQYRNLFLAMFTSSLGDWIGVVAILELTKQILGDTRAAAFGVSVVMIARIVPTLLLGPVAGVFVDRWDRKRTMIVTDIGRGVVFAMIAFATDVWALILATLVIEVMSTLFIPAKDSTLPNLVEERRLVEANQLSLGATYATFPLGGMFFALLVALGSTAFAGWQFLAERPLALAIWVNGLTFLVSAYFISRIRGLHESERLQQRAQREEAPGAWEEMVEGFRFIARHPLVRSLVIGVMAAFLAAGGVIAVGPFFASVVNAGSSGFGVLISVVGFGLFVGLAGTAPASKRIDKERLFAPGIGVAGVSLIAAALMPRLDLASIPAFIMGVGAGVSFVTGYTLLQEKTSDEIRGRTFAAFNTGVRAALFVSLILAPALVGVIGQEGAGIEGPVPYSIGGVRITLMVAGFIAFAGSVWTGRSIYQVLSRRESELALKPTGTGSPGMLVVLEGGEGAGKSTQIDLLRNALEEHGHEVVVTREPGGTKVGEQVRELLLDVDNDRLGDRTEALLYAAARAQHVDEVIRPALERGAVVLTDRYIDSSVVYQGTGRGLGEAEIEELNRWGTEHLEPDLVVLLDVDVDTGLQRVDGTPDRLEGAGRAFHEAVNEAFRRRAGEHPERWVVLDASRPVDELHRRVRDEVLSRVDQRTAQLPVDELPPEEQPTKTVGGR